MHNCIIDCESRLNRKSRKIGFFICIYVLYKKKFSDCKYYFQSFSKLILKILTNNRWYWKSFFDCIHKLFCKNYFWRWNIFKIETIVFRNPYREINLYRWINLFGPHCHTEYKCETLFKCCLHTISQYTYNIFRTILFTYECNKWIFVHCSNDLFKLF